MFFSNESFIEFAESAKLIGILLLVVVGYILSGIAEGCLVKGEEFNGTKLVKGIVQALTACFGLIIIAYTFTVVDLSSIGFYPKTAITSGIIVYAGKLVGKAMSLLGLSVNGKSKDGSDSNIQWDDISEDTLFMNNAKSENQYEEDSDENTESEDTEKNTTEEETKVESDDNSVG